MPRIIYIDDAGVERPVEVTAGHSVMEGATRNNVPGIDADCGGACACATCQVYVDPAWLERVGSASVMEDSMLDFAERKKPNSRLSCQIEVTNELDGLRVTTPISQR
jgi:ferredoxin, 2Fe-2S